MTDNLRGLIERLEKLEGPDREVEAEIDVLIAALKALLNKEDRNG